MPDQPTDEAEIQLDAELPDDDFVFEETDSQNVELGSAAKIKKLRDELAEAKRERDEYLTALQRSRADYVNLQRDEEKRRSDISKTLKIGLVEDLFTTLDAFDSAMSNRTAWVAVDPKWRVGVEYMYQNLIRTLETWGVIRIDATGKPFDPSLHEPVDYVESTDHPPDTVISVIQNGYKTNESVIRPSKVSISK
jgi:molecular chaperone GrpE